MIFLLELPLLLAVLPAPAVCWPLYGAVYIGGCLLQEWYMWTVRPRFRISLKMLLIALPLSFLLGKSYFYRTHFAWAVGFFQNLLSLSYDETLSLLTRVLGCLSVVSLLVLIGLGRDALQRQRSTGAETPLAAASRDGEIPWPGRRDTVFCALVALLTAAACFSLAPLYKKIPDFDVSVFLYIGREMTKGRVPYRDMFDHKGLVFYFIQALGVLLSPQGTYSGVWLLELLNLFAFCLLLYRLAGLISGSRPVRRLTVLAVAVACGTALYGTGDLTEEFALPWITFALYVFLHYFLSGRFKRRDIFFLGLGCGFVAFLRVNMIAPWLCLIPLTLVFLLIWKQAREILPCIGLFTLGLAAVCIPVLAYTLATGSLDEMIRYYILFNMEYSSYYGDLSGVVHTMMYLLYKLPLGGIALAVSLFYRAGDSRPVRRIHLINFLAFSFSLVLASMSGENLRHYAIFLLPLLALPICNTVEFLWPAGKEMAGTVLRRPIPPHLCVRKIRLAGWIAAFLLCAACASMNKPYASATIPSPDVDYLLSHTAPEDDVLIMDFGNSAYLKSGRASVNRFFYQDPPVNMSGMLYGDFLAEFEKKPSDVVLFYNQSYDPPSDLTNLGDFAQRMEQRRKAGEYTCEDLDGFCVYTRVR